MTAHRANDITDNPWIRRYRTSRSDAPRLICFPHAGGSATFCRPLAQALAPGIDVLAVQYPGRLDRRDDPFVGSVEGIAEEVTAALLPYADEPLALFGHSMGAAVAFEVARRLTIVAKEPQRLFVSGRRAPSAPPRTTTVHTMTDGELLARVGRLGGTDARVLGNEQIMRLALPALRNDYRALETYRPEPGARVGCPVTVLIGDSDPTTSLEEAAAWDAHTTSGCDLRVFEGGGHFYLTDEDRAKDVCDTIREGMRMPVAGARR